MNEEKIKKMEDQKVDNKNGFVPAMPKGSHTRCPLTDRMCDGKTCALWLDPSQSELKLISKMCLFRLAMRKIAGE